MQNQNVLVLEPLVCEDKFNGQMSVDCITLKKKLQTDLIKRFLFFIRTKIRKGNLFNFL